MPDRPTPPQAPENTALSSEAATMQSRKGIMCYKGEDAEKSALDWRYGHAPYCGVPQI